MMTDLGLRDLEQLLPVVCTTEELSRVLRIPVGTLGWLRYAGRGPRWVKAGSRVRYMRRDVLAWVQRGGE